MFETVYFYYNITRGRDLFFPALEMAVESAIKEAKYLIRHRADELECGHAMEIVIDRADTKRPTNLPEVVELLNISHANVPWIHNIRPVKTVVVNLVDLEESEES